MPVTMNATLFSVRVFRIIGLLLAILLSGCSAVRLGYSQAPELAYWWLDSYFDFTQAQTTRVRADLAALHAWHRSNELPIYLGLLDKLQRLTPGNVTPEQLCELYNEFLPRLNAAADQAEPTLTAVTLLLKPEQLAQLARQLDKRNETWREDWLDGTPGERRARHVKRLVDRAEGLYGRLDRHTDTLQTLRLIQSGGLGAERNRLEARGLLDRAVNSPDPIYRSQQIKLLQENCRTYAALHNSTSPSQRAKALETLKGYEADLRSLMAQRR
ncbi:MAG: hypothetical protein EBT05_04355 [Betaproteobacteria bacterium]|nr:hypothetical protein [Betaproteobacteria bacterium]